MGYTAANGVTTIATFDALNRVKTMLSEKTGGADVYNLSYKYDLAGNRRSAVETVSGQSTRNLSWDYDGLYRLVQESWTGPQAQTRSYSYDRAGNRTNRVIDTTASGGSKEYSTYGYDKLNRLTYSNTEGQRTSYEYDVNGNRITKYSGGQTTRYTYDTSNRLTGATINSTSVFVAAYDARTRRIGKTENGTSTIYRYDGGTNFQEKQSGSIVTELIRAGGLGGGIESVLYTDKPSEPVEYFVYNAVGHTMALGTGATESSSTLDLSGPHPFQVINLPRRVSGVEHRMTIWTHRTQVSNGINFVLTGLVCQRI